MKLHEIAVKLVKTTGPQLRQISAKVEALTRDMGESPGRAVTFVFLGYAVAFAKLHGIEVEELCQTLRDIMDDLFVNGDVALKKTEASKVN